MVLPTRLQFKVKYLMGCYEPTDFYIVKRIEFICIQAAAVRWVSTWGRWLVWYKFSLNTGENDSHFLTQMKFRQKKRFFFILWLGYFKQKITIDTDSNFFVGSNFNNPNDYN